jgi:hypothetical protein
VARKPLKRRNFGCVKTLRGIIAPGILGSVVMRRAKKQKNLSSARHYDQIRFRFHTTKTHLCHRGSRSFATHNTRHAAQRRTLTFGERVGQKEGV